MLTLTLHPPPNLSSLDIGERDIGAVVIEWDGKRVGVPVHSARPAGSGDPMAEISRVARPSADEEDGTDAVGAANDGCVVTMELVSVPPRQRRRHSTFFSKLPRQAERSTAIPELAVEIFLTP
jgi:hypothetical protein